ncbi:hypothetical protein L6164_028993 [Bauhinia variegata]|uniref:Uncharacterized protein n=1 Tax=Bauhinia variegata TaxID=167791 RepID=A0ACB9L8D1_BAUVA|nr:hypothetical protein L6164_028993 [Bauhinia variegata]
MKRAELVFVPAPGISHLVSTVEFARLLINRDERLSITFLVMKRPFDTKVDAYTQSLTSSFAAGRVRFIDLPGHKSDGDKPHPRSFFTTFIENKKPHVREEVSKLTESNSGPDSPRLAAFVVDMFCTTMSEVANEFGVPTFVFFTSGAAFLGLVLHTNTLRERDNVDSTEFKDSDTELEIPSFANPVPPKVLPALLTDKEWTSFAVNYEKSLKAAKGIIVNSFEELESHAIHSFSDSGYPIIYPVGPVLSLKGDYESGSHVKDDVIKWLDDQPESSVVFLCFGSRGAFDGDQVIEIARALEESGVRFLWALRKPPPKGTMAAPTVYDNLEEILPEGFLDRTAQIGKIIGWAPQLEILAHRAVGGFVSHCGWNSTLESIYFGVPIATWPLYAEQQLNAFLILELGLGVEIAMDFRVDFMSERNVVLGSEKIVKGIKDLMVEESEIRKKSKEMSEKSRSTLAQGGCSYSYLGKFIDDILCLI